MTTPAKVQHVASRTAQTTNSLVLTVGKDDGTSISGFVATTVGNKLVIRCHSTVGSYASQVTDSRGNQWTFRTTSAGSTATARIASATITTSLVANDTITVTFTGSQNGTSAAVEEWSGLLTGNASDGNADNQASGSSGFTNTVESPLSTQAGDLAIAAAGFASIGPYTLTTADPDTGGSWTDLAYPGGTVPLQGAYQILPTGGNSKCKVSWSNSNSANSEVAIALFKAVGSPVTQALTATATDPVTGQSASATANFTLNSGGGTQQVPGAPTGLSVVATTDTTVQLAWTAPTSGPVTSYNVYENGGSVPVLTGLTDVSAVVTGLTANTGYTFTVSAVNSTGEGAQSSSVAATTSQTAPAAPTGLAASGTTANSTSLSWTAPSGTVSGYYVYQNGTRIQTVLSTSATVTGLSSSTSYTFTVAAFNSGGTSPQSSGVNVTTSGSAPGAPTGLAAASVTTTGFTLSWTAPSGSPASYTVFQNGVAIATPTGTSQAITGLSPSTTYSFTVSATNASGTGPQSAALSVTTQANTTSSVLTYLGYTPGGGAGETGPGNPDLTGYTTAYQRTGPGAPSGTGQPYAMCTKLFDTSLGYPNFPTAWGGLAKSFATANGSANPIVPIIVFNNIPTASQIQAFLASLPSGQKCAFQYQSEHEGGLTASAFVSGWHSISVNLNTALSALGGGSIWSRANFPMVTSSLASYYQSNPGSTAYFINGGINLITGGHIDSCGIDLYHRNLPGSGQSVPVYNDPRFTGFVSAVHSAAGSSNVSMSFPEYGISFANNTYSASNEQARATLLSQDWAYMTGSNRPTGTLPMMFWNYWYQMDSQYHYCFPLADGSETGAQAAATTSQWQTMLAAAG